MAEVQTEIETKEQRLEAIVSDLLKSPQNRISEGGITSRIRRDVLPDSEIIGYEDPIDGGDPEYGAVYHPTEHYLNTPSAKEVLEEMEKRQPGITENIDLEKLDYAYDQDVVSEIREAESLGILSEAESAKLLSFNKDADALTAQGNPKEDAASQGASADLVSEVNKS